MDTIAPAQEPPTYEQDLLAYLAAGRSPFHAATETARRLEDAGFAELDERAAWHLVARGRYYVRRNDSSLIAFVLPGDGGSVGGAGTEAGAGAGAGRMADHLAERGLRMAGAHTDSPSLRLKPNPVLTGRGYTRLGLEVYGGVLLNPWFDRDLSLAGRVHVRMGDGTLRGLLLDFDRPLAFIPSLAIHLDREVNQKRSINPQTDIPALLGRGEVDLKALLLRELQARDPALVGTTGIAEVLDWELCLYDCQAPRVVGIDGEFIAAARLDNLLSCHAATQAIIDAPAGAAALVVLNDHEEVGSTTADGAQGPFLEQVLARLLPDVEGRARCIAASIFVSADNAHGIHPNYPDRHDDRHGPLLNAGPVLKVNANQRYASTSETQAFLRDAAARAGVELQVFVTRTDLACGSTIGPLTAARIGVRTVDVGVPQLGMHSIRELCGRNDPHALYRLLVAVFAG